MEGFDILISHSESMLSRTVSRLRPMSKQIISKIEKSKSVFIIKGLRGVGKTTLLIEFLSKKRMPFYVNGDLVVKYGHDLYEVLKKAYNNGFRVFGIDEAQEISEWWRDVKLFYDETKAKIIVTGSSAVELSLKASDLARRSKVEELKPFSFREYIYMKEGKLIPKLSLNDLIKKPNEYIRVIAPYIRLYKPFLENDALPAAFFESPSIHKGIIERIIYRDLLPLKSIDISYVEAVFKTLKFIATSKPGEISYNKLASSLRRSTKFTISLINLLKMSGLLKIIQAKAKGHRLIRSQDKITLLLPFRHALWNYFKVEGDVGSLREDFFLHHVDVDGYVAGERKNPDYIIGKNIFEIGGAGKSRKQLEQDGFLVKESLEARGKSIPLYLFGLLY